MPSSGVDRPRSRCLTLARLRPLRESGVLVNGSGFLRDGLPFVTADMIDSYWMGLAERSFRASCPRGRRPALPIPAGLAQADYRVPGTEIVVIRQLHAGAW